MKKTFFIFLTVLSCFAHSSEITIQPLLKKYCYDCHSDKKAKGGLNLEHVNSLNDIFSDFKKWEMIIDQVEHEDMPPEDDPQPSEEERQQMTSWIKNVFKEAESRSLNDPGPAPIRRLNKYEYNNTIRDLTGIDLKPADIFPSEGGGGEGFDNNAEVMRSSPLMIEKFFEAANTTSQHLHFSFHSGFQFNDAKLSITNDAQYLRQLDKEKTSIRNSVFPSGFKAQDQIKNYLEYAWQARFKKLSKEQKAKIVPHFLKKWLKYLGPKYDDKKTPFELKAIKAWRELNAQSSPEERQKAYKHYHDQMLYARRTIDHAKEPEKTELKSFMKALNRQNFYFEKLEFMDYVSEETQRTYRNLQRETKLIESTQDKKYHLSAALKKRLFSFLKSFMNKAWRQAPRKEQLISSVNDFMKDWRKTKSLQTAAQNFTKRVLSSPNFLFRLEQNNLADEPQLINDYELASRLSYFLWSSMPDQELLSLAEKGQLNDEKILKQQVSRMLINPRSEALSHSFAAQWLAFRDVFKHSANKNDFPEFSQELQKLFYQEASGYFQQLVKHNLPLRYLSSSNKMWINEELAKHYGLSNVKGKNFRWYTSQDERRGGLLSTGAVSLITSYPKRTSPVLRGNWVLNHLLGTPTPPAPADAGTLESNKVPENLSIKERLEIHRTNKTCNACHKRIDPLGFPLEKLDPLGRFRETVGGHKIDNSSRISRKDIVGVSGLKKHLISEEKQIAKNFTSKLLAYSLGRSLQFYDTYTVNKIIKENSETGYQIQDMIQSVVLSFPFRYRRATKNLEAKK